MNNVTTAIDRSISHNETVTVHYEPGLVDELASLADDSIEMSYDRGPDEAPGRMIEFWGYREPDPNATWPDDGGSWRVQVLA